MSRSRVVFVCVVRGVVCLSCLARISASHHGKAMARRPEAGLAEDGLEDELCAPYSGENVEDASCVGQCGPQNSSIQMELILAFVLLRFHRPTGCNCAAHEVLDEAPGRVLQRHRTGCTFNDGVGRLAGVIRVAFLRALHSRSI